MSSVNYKLGTLALAIQSILIFSHLANASPIFPDAFTPEKITPNPDSIINDSAYKDASSFFNDQWQDSGNVDLSGNYYLNNFTIQRPNSGPGQLMLRNNSHLFNSTILTAQITIGDPFQSGSTDSATNIRVSNTGFLIINSGAIAYDVTVERGGNFSLRSNSQSYNTLISSGGRQTLGGNSYAQATTIIGGLQELNGSSSAAVKDTRIMDGGQQIIYEGSALNTHIIDGGYQHVSGRANYTYIYNGGYQDTYDDNQGIAADQTKIYLGGTQRVRSGQVTNTEISGLQIISNRGGLWDPIEREWSEVTDPNDYYYYHGESPTAINSTIQNSGIQLVEKNGLAEETFINGGRQIIKNGGMLKNTTLFNDGTTSIEYGGLAKGLINANHGTVLMEAGDQYSTLGNSAESIYLGSESAQLHILNTTNTNKAMLGIGQLKMKNGQLHFDNNTNVFSVALIDDLSGQGDIVMNTNIQANQGDFLDVHNVLNNEQFTIAIKDQGSGISNQRLHLISAADQSLASSFKLNENSRYVDHGAYMLEYLLQHETDTNDNLEKWYLTTQQSNLPTPTADAVMAMANVTPSIWDAELTTLRQRLGELDNNHKGGAWGRVISSRYKVDKESGAAYKQDMNGFVVGGDHAITQNNGTWHLGAMAGYSRSDIDFRRGGNGDVDSYTLAAYASFFADNGWYTDSVIKYNYFKHNTNARTSQGTKASGKYNLSGLGASFELGKKYRNGALFAAPYGLVSGFYAGNKSYHLDNGLKAKVGSARSLKTEVGSLLGYDLTINQMQLQPYVKLAVNHEWIDSNKVDFDNQHRFSNDMSGSAVKVGIGANAQFSTKFSAYGEVNHMQGKDVSMPYSLNLGIRYQF